MNIYKQVATHAIFSVSHPFPLLIDFSFGNLFPFSNAFFMLNMNMNISATVTHQLLARFPAVLARHCWSPSTPPRLIIWFTEGEARTSKHTATFNLGVWRNLARCHSADFHVVPFLPRTRPPQSCLYGILPLSPPPPPFMCHWWVNSKRRWLWATKPWEDSKKKKRW